MINLQLTVDNFVIVDLKPHIDISQCTHDLAAPTLCVTFYLKVFSYLAIQTCVVVLFRNSIHVEWLI